MNTDIFYILANYIAFIFFSSSIIYQIIYVFITKNVDKLLIKSLLIRVLGFGTFLIYLIKFEIWHTVYTTICQLVLTILLISMILYYRKFPVIQEDKYELF